jgi:glycosyltransferase involved in cell wall biosynthesis
MPEFDIAYEALRRHHQELARVQVTHGELHELVLSSGIDPAKVFLIRIGINLSLFPEQTAESRTAARAALGLPESAFVVGSFHKDGVGFDTGTQPKLIKGPDVLLDVCERLRARVAEFHVLLAGPARGYVKEGLVRLGIPYRHRYLEEYEEIGGLYQALDAYLVPSRQEGGPKGVLEAMACGVPVVSTRVGQAAELIRPGQNGWLEEVEDAEALAGRLAEVAEASGRLTDVIAEGRATAAANAYEAQLPLWREFFSGFVETA